MCLSERKGAFSFAVWRTRTGVIEHVKFAWENIVSKWWTSERTRAALSSRRPRAQNEGEAGGVL